MLQKQNISYIGKDLIAVIRLLTRFPMPSTSDAASKLSPRAVWAFPVVGLLIGLITSIIFWLAIGIGLAPLLAAFLTVITSVLCTGALHEDGLADFIDGFGGGYSDKEKILEIMRDTHIGTFGTLALIFSVGLRVAALMTIGMSENILFVLLAAHAISRSFIPLLMHVLPPARNDGLSVAIGRPNMLPAFIALLIGFGVAVFSLGGVLAVMVLAIVGGMVLMIGGWVKIRISGQTGDVLGATQQMAEIATLLIISVFYEGWI